MACLYSRANKGWTENNGGKQVLITSLLHRSAYKGADENQDSFTSV